MDFVSILTEHGWPAAFIGLILYVIQRFAKYATPRADRLIEAHVGLVDSLKATVGEQGEKIHEIHEHVVGRQDGTK